MNPINLLSPAHADRKVFLRVPSIAKILSPTRNLNDPAGFEQELGTQQFEIFKRNRINTNWFIEWQGQFYKIIGIFPGPNITKSILYSRLVEFRHEIADSLDVTWDGDVITWNVVNLEW